MVDPTVLTVAQKHISFHAHEKAECETEHDALDHGQRPGQTTPRPRNGPIDSRGWSQRREPSSCMVERTRKSRARVAISWSSLVASGAGRSAVTWMEPRLSLRRLAILPQT